MLTSHTPSRAALPHTVTLFNWTGDDEQQSYQKTIIQYVRLDFRKQTNILATGSSNADDIELFIFNGASVARDFDGNMREFLPAYQFLRLPPEEQAKYWTLNAGEDYVGMGIIDGDVSKGGERQRKDYSINVVDPKYGASNRVHHWEVSGA